MTEPNWSDASWTQDLLRPGECVRIQQRGNNPQTHEVFDYDEIGIFEGIRWNEDTGTASLFFITGRDPETKEVRALALEIGQRYEAILTPTLAPPELRDAYDALFQVIEPDSEEED